MDNLILVINPGSTSTKIAVFDGRNELFLVNVKHQQEIHRTAPAGIKSDERREQHERREPGLDQIREDGRPTFFRDHGRV